MVDLTAAAVAAAAAWCCCWIIPVALRNWSSPTTLLIFASLCSVSTGTSSPNAVFLCLLLLLLRLLKYSTLQVFIGIKSIASAMRIRCICIASPPPDGESILPSSISPPPVHSDLQNAFFTSSPQFVLTATTLDTFTFLVCRPLSTFFCNSPLKLVVVIW